MLSTWLITVDSNFHQANLSTCSIYLFHHLFISIWTHEYLFYILSYNPMLLYFLVPIIPALTTESSFSGLLPPLPHLHHYLDLLLNIPLFSGTKRFFKVIFCVLWPSSRTCCFWKESWVIFFNDIGNCNLHVTCVHSDKVIIASRTSHLSKQQHVCVHTNLCLYLYVYVRQISIDGHLQNLLWFLSQEKQIKLKRMPKNLF